MRRIECADEQSAGTTELCLHVVLLAQESPVLDFRKIMECLCNYKSGLNQPQLCHPITVSCKKILSAYLSILDPYF